mgnify:CR=1 FL=1
MSSTTTAPSGTARTTPPSRGLIKDPTTNGLHGSLHLLEWHEYKAHNLY